MSKSKNDYYYKLGIREAYRKREPLYGVLVAAEDSDAATAYRRGWAEVTDMDLGRYRAKPTR